MVSSVKCLRKSSIITLFRERLEDHGGRVYETSSIDQAAETLAKLLIGEGVKSVVLAHMPPEVNSKIMESVKRGNISPLESTEADVARAINSVDAGVTMAKFASADTGSIVEVTYDDVDRLVSALPRIHVCLLSRASVVERFEDSAELVRNSVGVSKPSVVTFISGPSRTADVELKLVMGVHGPHQLHVIVFGEG